MKRFLILLSLLFCNTVCADTINLHWINYDGTTYQDSTCEIDSDLILPSAPPTRYGYTFTGWKISNYIPIEYLESTGTQWIDTGVNPGDDIGVNIDVAWLAIDGERQILGTRYNNGSVRFYVPFLYNGRFAYAWESWIESNINGAIDTIYNIKFNYLNNRVITINNNDISILNSNLPENTAGETLPLFAAFYENYEFILTGRIYKVQITKGTDFVRDFIPVLDYNGTPCMFDRVEGKFYYNAGTGQFIAGPSL